MAKILVIDDSPSIIEMIGSALRDDGHHVETLTTFVELPLKLVRYRPELIVLDLQMPGLDGVSMGQYVRKFEERPLPIILYSGEPAARLAQAVSSLGAQAAVSKSDGVASLCSKVREILNESHAGSPVAG